MSCKPIWLRQLCTPHVLRCRSSDGGGQTRRVQCRVVQREPATIVAHAPCDEAGETAPGPAVDPSPERAGRRPLGAARLRALVTGLCAAAVLAQLAGMVAWSAHLAARASLSWDFAINYQAWYEIAHGHLLARNTLQGGYLFIRNNGELVVYLLAPLYWLFPDHPLGYLWLQDLAIAAVSATCLLTVAEQLPWRVRAPAREQAVAASARVLVVLLVVLNPFVYWTASFDIHMEVFGACFAMLTLRAGLAHRRSTIGWAALTALCGTASLLYVVGVGLTLAAVYAWRSRRAPGRAAQAACAIPPGRKRALPWRHPALATARWPLAMSLAALVWLAVLNAAHATVGSPGRDYGYLTGAAPNAVPGFGSILLGILEHPATAARVIASHGWNLWANTSPDGFVGLFGPALLLVALPLLTNNLLRGQSFSYPSFQNFVVYGAVALGTVAVVVALLRRRRLWPLGVLLAAGVVWNAGGWFGAWFSTTSSYVQVSPAAARLVERVASQARPGDEIVASQGVIGLLAGHPEVQGFLGPTVAPVRSRTVWFVLSETQGVQVASPTETVEAIESVSHLRGVHALDVDVDGIWVYRWHPPAGVRWLRLGGIGSRFPVWMFPGPQVVARTTGPPDSWSVGTDGHTVYLVVGDFFQLPPGRYVARVRMRSDVPVTAEVWSDAMPERILGAVTATPIRPQNLRIAFSVAKPRSPALRTPLSGGPGWFRIDPDSSSPLQPTVEVRVWVPQGAVARAWWTSITPVRVPTQRPAARARR